MDEPTMQGSPKLITSPNMKLLKLLIEEGDRRRLETYGSMLEVFPFTGEETEIYRKRLLYAVQENERHHQGLATPARVQARIDDLNNGDGGGLLMAKIAAAKADKKGNAVKVKGPTVGGMARELIVAGKTFEQIEAAVKKAFPDSTFNKVCYSWYKNDLKKKGIKFPELEKKAAPAKVKKAAAPKVKKEKPAVAVAAPTPAQATAQPEGL